MKNKLFLIAFLCLFCLPFAGPKEGALSFKGGETAKGFRVGEAGLVPTRELPSPTLHFLPAIDTDFSDLDVRDHQNKPINDPQKKSVLTALFMDDLYKLTVLSNTHILRQICSDLELYSLLFNNLILNSVQTAKRIVQEALQPPQKRFVHNGDKLWIMLSVVVLCSALLLSQFQLKNQTLRLILRC